MEIKLNLGCHKTILPGFINIDLVPFEGVQIEDIIYLKSFENNSVDFIYASHCLHTFSRSNVSIALKNWYRVLKPGSQIIIEVDNMVPIMQQYLAGKIPVIDGILPMGRLVQGFFGKDEEGMRKYIAFDFEYLSMFMTEAGFKNIKQINKPPYSRHCSQTNICVVAIK